jgi:diguanylate cyclase
MATATHTPRIGTPDARWLPAALVLAVAVAAAVIAGFDVAWRVAVVLIGLTCTALAWRRNQLPGVFAVAFVVTTLRLSLVSTGDLAFTIRDATWLQAGTDLVAGPMLIVVLLLALRARRGRLGLRELLDGVMVAVAAGIPAWILLANPVWVDGSSVLLAVGAAAYVPVAFMLLTFTLELFLDGLLRNRAMWLALGSVTGNLIATVVRSLEHSDAIAAPALRGVAGLFIASFLMLCYAIVHPQAPAVLHRFDDLQPHPYRELVRLAPLSFSLLAAVMLTALVDSTSTTDRVVRACAAGLLAGIILVRLYVAFEHTARAQHHLERRLNHDELTDLVTRSRFLAHVTAVLETHWRSELHPTLIQINIDRFKNINDTLGHDAANRLLVRLAERLTEVADCFGGVVARAGGDEFIVLDSTTHTEDDAMTRAATIATALSRPVQVGETAMFVTASIGVAVAPRNRTIGAEELMRRADIATHRAKADGRNRIIVFDDSMHADLTQRMAVENALHGAIGRHEMRLYHQPIVDIGTGHLTGFEALIRWRRADGTVVSPGQFIPIAEETGIINELGAWALLEALTDLRRWIDDGLVPPITTMSVNVSPRQIAAPDFAAVVRDALDRSDVPPHLLWIEMTESMMLDEPMLAQTTLTEIRAMGVRLALDDFGTGYSSLSLLQQFPIQRIKIDRAFVQGIADRSNDRSLVRTIIAMAQSMGLDLVAEGVETVHQLRALRELGCDKAQGFLISHPVPTEAMRSTMSALNELASLTLFSAADRLTTSRDHERAYGGPVSYVGTVPSRPLGGVATQLMG